jgi:hypothetical protein
MPILVDYSQVMLATLFASIGNHTNIELSEDLVRHMFLESLRGHKTKLSPEYGDVVICCDGKNSWRREAFPYYKANRRSSREKSDLDWNEMFRIMGVIREELAEHFPYKVLMVDRCEADDIIGTVCHHYGSDSRDGERFLILSGDKDYVQLQTYANVDQYDPVGAKFIRHADPEMFLREHVLKGDSGDGVPNVLSPDNCLVIGERQKPMTAKRLASLLGPSSELHDQQTLSRIERNRTLIDLTQTPEEYKQQILELYKTPKTVGRSKLFAFFMDKRLRNLMQDIGDF